MKKGNMTTLASVFVIALVALGVGMGTMAYFSEVVQATGNTFTAGFLDIELSTVSSTGPWVSGPISGFWDSPAIWAPGESYTRTLYFKNVGNVPVQVVLIDFKNYVTTEQTFWNVIEVEEFWEYDTPFNLASYIDSAICGDGDGTLTLHELIINNRGSGYVGNTDMILMKADKGPCPDYPTCGAYHGALLGGTYLTPGQVGYITLGFKFSSTASNLYESDICSFDLQMSFIQGPDSGICRHEMPGFVP